MTEKSTDILSFLDFKLNLKSGALSREGQKIALPDKEGQLLKYLAERQGTVVSREALEKHAGWKRPVHESRLSQAITTIRQALCISPYVTGVSRKSNKRAQADETGSDRVGPPKKRGARPVDEIVLSHYGDGYSFRPPFAVTDFSSEGDRHVNLCGREKLFSHLNNCLNDITFDRGFILVEGSPGVGKSAALYQWREERHAPADKLVVYHCIRRGVNEWDQPHAVLRNLLAQLGRGAHDDAVAERPDSLRDVLFSELAALQPALVILDGADELSAAPGTSALREILPTSLPRGVWVCIGSRPGPWLDWLNSITYVRRVDLERGWSHRSLCLEYWGLLRSRSATYERLSDEFIRAAVVASGNNILYNVFLAQGLASRGPDEPEPDARTLPVSFESYLGEAWAALSATPDVQDALRVFCITRAPLSSAQISIVLDREAFDHLASARPLVLHTAGEYRLFHESLRDFIVKQTPASQMVRLHRRLADSLAKWPPDARHGEYGLVHALHHRTHADRPRELRELCFDQEYLAARVGADVAHGSATLDTDLRAAAHFVTDAEIGRDIAALHAAISRQWHWLRHAPEALGDLMQTALRRSGWSVPASSFALEAVVRFAKFLVVHCCGGVSLASFVMLIA